MCRPTTRVRKLEVERYGPVVKAWKGGVFLFPILLEDPVHCFWRTGVKYGTDIWVCRLVLEDLNCYMSMARAQLLSAGGDVFCL